MNKIQNFNCEGMCIEEICDKKYTQYIIMEINGMKLNLSFCDKHAEEFEQKEHEILVDTLKKRSDKNVNDRI